MKVSFLELYLLSLFKVLQEIEIKSNLYGYGGFLGLNYIAQMRLCND